MLIPFNGIVRDRFISEYTGRTGLIFSEFSAEPIKMKFGVEEKIYSPLFPFVQNFGAKNQKCDL